MAQVKVYCRSSELAANRSKLSDVIHGCVVEALAVPVEKRFHRFFGLADEDFIHPADRSHRYTIIELSLFEGRSVQAKKHLIALLFARLERELAIAPVDVEITLTETAKHNWGIRGQPGDELELNYKVNV